MVHGNIQLATHEIQKTVPSAPAYQHHDTAKYGPCVSPLICWHTSSVCDAAGGMVEFRRSLAASFLFRFFVHVASQLEAELPGYQPIFPDTYKSAALPFHRPPVQGLQYYSKVPGEAIVGQPSRHMAADLQVQPPCSSSLSSHGSHAVSCSVAPTYCTALQQCPVKPPSAGSIVVIQGAWEGFSSHVTADSAGCTQPCLLCY